MRDRDSHAADDFGDFPVGMASRGMGSIFYIAYAQNHVDIDGIDAVWRIAGLTILMSIIIHGTLADNFMEIGQTELENKTS